MNNELIIGVVADDFTGASDAASYIAKGGLTVTLSNGIPDTKIQNTSSIVIALKSRTQNTQQAVKESLDAYRYLKNLGAKVIYNKYCSTFDSTHEGNIGPISDAMLIESGEPYTLLCPSLPINGRTIKKGHLFVNGIPLHETHMKNHPLTPMWSSSIKELMSKQSQFSVYLRKQTDSEKPYYIVPDYATDSDGKSIVQHYNGLSFFTGGSGLLEHLANFFGSETNLKGTFTKTKNSRTLILVGSLSEISTRQIEDAKAKGMTTIELNQTIIKSPNDMFETINNGNSLMVYSPREKSDLSSLEIEKTFSILARLAIKEGFTNIIVGGGETSGAVMKSIGSKYYQIGESVAPGVPIMIPCDNSDLRIVLKSGNFGGVTFFSDAMDMMGVTR